MLDLNWQLNRATSATPERMSKTDRGKKDGKIYFLSLEKCIRVNQPAREESRRESRMGGNDGRKKIT